MKKLIYYTSILILLFITSCSKDKSYPDIAIQLHQSDKSEITTLSTDECGYLIYDPEQNKTIKAFNMQKPFIPASVTKLYTTVLSLEMLNPEYRFQTELLYTGKINNGIMEGSLFLRGGGDPELSIHDLINIILEMKSRGIKSVKGQFIYDIRLFDSRDTLNKNMAINARYNPGFSPLNLNGNITYALKKRDEKGELTGCELIPAVPSNRAYLYDGPDVLLYARYSHVNDVETWGLPSHGRWENRFQLPVKNTGLFTASVFRELCSIHGIAIPAPERGAVIPGAKKITVHKSRVISHIIRDMLCSSDNLTSEITGTLASKELSNRNENNPPGVEIFFRRSFPSISWEEFRMDNYSGLTDTNRATPEQTVAMLIYLSRFEQQSKEQKRLLPLSGLDGTMKSKLDVPGTAFRIYAKTGSIYYASALAGDFIAATGKKYLFAVFIDNKVKRRQYSDAGNGSIEAAQQAEKWSVEASKSIELFITNQIKEL